MKKQEGTQKLSSMGPMERKGQELQHLSPLPDCLRFIFLNAPSHIASSGANVAFHSE